MPIANLPVGEGPERQQTTNSGNGKPSSGDLACLNPVGCQPGDRQKQANERDVGIAIRHRLKAHLHQPDHRHQASQEPEPSDGKIPAIARADDQSGDEQQ